MAPEICPQCGAVVPPRAKACSQCGSDDSTGWSDAAKLDQLGIPAEEFDHEAFVTEEFGDGRPKTGKNQWIWWVTALALVLIFLWCWR